MLKPPFGLAQVAGIALYEILSALSAKATSPKTENIILYENIASTTPHSSIPLEGCLVGGSGSNSSPRNIPCI